MEYKMQKHPLDTGTKIFGVNGDITNPEERYKFFESVEQEQLSMLRQERNRRLVETDWWALSDRQMTPEQTAYRQALRDITDNYKSQIDVVWPELPTS